MRLFRSDLRRGVGDVGDVGAWTLLTTEFPVSLEYGLGRKRSDGGRPFGWFDSPFGIGDRKSVMLAWFYMLTFHGPPCIEEPWVGEFRILGQMLVTVSLWNKRSCSSSSVSIYTCFRFDNFLTGCKVIVNFIRQTQTVVWQESNLVLLH